MNRRTFALTICSFVAVLAVIWLIVRPGATVAAKVRERAAGALGRLVPAFELASDVHVSFSGSITLGPVALHLRNAQTPAEIRIERIILEPVLTSLVAADPRVGHVHLEGVAIDLGDSVAGARATIDAYRAWRAARPAARASELDARAIPSLSAAEIKLALPVSAMSTIARTVVLSGVEAEAQCDHGCNAGIALRLASGGAITASLSEDRAEHVSFIVDTRGRAVDLAALPQALLLRLPVRVEQGLADGSLLITIDTDGTTPSSIDLTTELVARDVTLEAPRLAADPVRLTRASAAAHIAYRADDQRIVVDDAYVGIGDDPRLRVAIGGTLATVPPYAMAAHLVADDVPCAKLIATLPAAIAPIGDEPRPRGVLIGRLDLEGPAREPEAWTLTGDIDTHAAHGDALTGAEPLKASFTHEAVDEHDTVHPFVVGPANPDFVPIAELPAHVVRAVTTAEDGGFYGHHGFDFAEIQNSLASVLTARKIRGGSTITQQLAKNLYLSHERTYARKVREAFIALALESTLGKNRMLEIYLNIIEWGPGIYGIGAAARHYFGTSATELTPKEAAFLASIIPNPVRYHGYYARGELTETWNTRVNDILDKMHVVGVLDDDTHSASIAAPVVFR